jgi:hypothetical protein
MSDVYSHLFDQASHAEDIRQRMAESTFGRLLGPSNSSASGPGRTKPTTARREALGSTAKFSGRTWDRTRDLPRVKRALSR